MPIISISKQPPSSNYGNPLKSISYYQIYQVVSILTSQNCLFVKTKFPSGKNYVTIFNVFFNISQIIRNNDVGVATPLDLTSGGNVTVCKQNDFQQHSLIIHRDYHQRRFYNVDDRKLKRPVCD